MGPNPEPAGILQIQELVNRAISISIPFAFITLTFLILWAGYLYLTSGGDSGNIKKAAGLLTWGLLGILFFALSWLILRLVEAYTGVPLTKFCLGFPGVPTACPN